MTKHAIRQQMLTRRSDMASDEVLQLSDQIMRRLVDLIDWSTIEHVHVYQSNSKWNEVSTTNLRDYVLIKAPSVELTFGEVSTLAAMPNESYDLIIVPIVAFDPNRQRIGFGGGWYDRFLAKQPHAQKIGLAFELQKVVSVGIESHDVPLSAVITETRVY